MASTYIGKHFFRPMLPSELNSDCCSLKEGKVSPAVSIYFYISDEGLIDFDNIEFCMTFIMNYY